MPITLQSVQRAFPKAFQGPYAQMNEKLARELSYHGTFSHKLNGIRNGIAVVESPIKENFGTTVERGIYTLDEKGNLVCLKLKAIYHSGPNPSANDNRTISGKWSYFPKTKEMEHITAVSRGGRLLTKEVAREANASNCVSGQFYWLPSNRMKSFEAYNFGEGSYQKILRDTTGNRGVYGEHGRLVFKDGKATTETIKDGSFTYNENLGGVVSVKRPKEDFRLGNFFTMLESLYDKGIQEAVKKHLIG